MFGSPFQFSYLQNPQNPMGMPQGQMPQGPMPPGLLGGGPNPMAFMQNPMMMFGMNMMNRGRRRPMGMGPMGNNPMSPPNPMNPFGPFGGM